MVGDIDDHFHGFSAEKSSRTDYIIVQVFEAMPLWHITYRAR
jgi:hypothetical protein